MIAYKEIAQIKNVRGLNPVTGDYSYERRMGMATSVLMVSCLKKRSLLLISFL